MHQINSSLMHTCETLLHAFQVEEDAQNCQIEQLLSKGVAGSSQTVNRGEQQLVR